MGPNSTEREALSSADVSPGPLLSWKSGWRWLQAASQGRKWKITKGKKGVVAALCLLVFIFLFFFNYKSNEGPLGNTQECLKQKISHLKLLHPKITIVNSLTDFLFQVFVITWANWPWERKAQQLLRWTPVPPPWPRPAGFGRQALGSHQRHTWSSGICGISRV